MKKLIIILVLILSFQACKKDRLTKEKEILVGTWNWQYTTVYHYCDGFFQSYVLDSLTENETYKVVFFKKGEVQFFKGNNLISEHRIIFDYAYIPKGGIVESNKKIKTHIYLDGDPNNAIYIFGTPKDMRFNYFPFISNTECNKYYGNYFKKEY